MDDQGRRDFLAAYEASRNGGDVSVLRDHLSERLVLEDPQLERGVGSRETLLALTEELVEQTEDLSIRPHGPVCVSEDGTWFTQRWLGRGRAAATGGDVAFETVEVYQASGARVDRVAILVRDLKQARPQPTPADTTQKGSA
jgi:hypothetical protein